MATMLVGQGKVIKWVPSGGATYKTASGQVIGLNPSTNTITYHNLYPGRIVKTTGDVYNVPGVTAPLGGSPSGGIISPQVKGISYTQDPYAYDASQKKLLPGIAPRANLVPNLPSPVQPSPPPLASTPTYTGKGAQAYEATGDESVMNQLNRLIMKGGPYQQLAVGKAMETAASRGLLNTSIAAGAGYRAALESALPIAQQDAGYYQELGKARQEGIIKSGLQSQEGIIKSGLQSQAAGEQAGLLGVQAGYEKELQAQMSESEIQLQKIKDANTLLAQTQSEEARMKLQDVINEAEMNLLRAQQTGDLAAQIQAEKAAMEQLEKQIEGNVTLQKIADDNAYYRQNAEFEAEKELKAMEISAEKEAGAMEHVRYLAQQWQTDAMRILTSPDYVDEESRNIALDVLESKFAANLDLIFSLAGLEGYNFSSTIPVGQELGIKGYGSKTMAAYQKNPYFE